MPENYNDSLKVETGNIYTEASPTDDSNWRLEDDVSVYQVFLNKRNSFQNSLVADANKYVKSQTHENKNDLTSQFWTFLLKLFYKLRVRRHQMGYLWFIIGKQVYSL